MAGLTLKRTAHARAYSTAAIPSSNPQTVSPRTLKAENACHDRKAAETIARCPRTGQRLKRVTEASRGLSGLISAAYRLRLTHLTAHGLAHLVAHSNAHKRQAIAAAGCTKWQRTVAHSNDRRITEASYHERRRTVNDSGGPHLARQAITNSTTQLATTAHAPSTGRV